MDAAMQIDSARLKQLRQQRAWSQEHLAALTGLSVRTIQRLESGAVKQLSGLVQQVGQPAHGALRSDLASARLRLAGRGARDDRRHLSQPG